MTEVLYTSLSQNGVITSNREERRYAPHACLVCRKQKRKCTKELPQCKLCTRLKRDCDYSAPLGPSSNTETSSLQARINELEKRLEGQHVNTANGSSHVQSSQQRDDAALRSRTDVRGTASLPPLFFLDSEVFREGRFSVPRISPSVSNQIYNLAGSLRDVHETVSTYFKTIHIWLPFISKKRMDLSLADPDTEVLPETALLIAAMRLITLTAAGLEDDTRTELYDTTRSYFSLLEGQGALSMQMLQVGILLGIYEMGHGIYPAAYLSPGRCARIGQAIGIDNRLNSPQMFGRKSGSWTEQEEMRRSWWVIMLLDRFVNLNIVGHSLATDDPHKDETLPADCANWDKGEMASSEPLYVATPTTVQAGPFARTCQAANLMGGFIRHRNDKHSDYGNRVEEALQLHRTLKAFSNLLPDELAQHALQICTATALTLTTSLHLYDPYCCSASRTGPFTPRAAEMQRIAIDSIHIVAHEIRQFSQMIGSLLSSSSTLVAGVGVVSPFVIECLYQSASTYAWLVHETGNPDRVEAYHEIRGVLMRLNHRWRVAGEYLKILDQSKDVLFEGNQLL